MQAISAIDAKAIHKVSDFELMKSTDQAVMREREASRVLLLHLAEIERRRPYAERGFSSLFQMLVKHWKVSETSAKRRIDAMRLYRDVPEALESLKKGEVSAQ